MQRSTAPVERERAERAMTALYEGCGLAAPRFLWVDDPSDGLMAWHLVSRGRQPLRNPWTKGDWGIGRNRDLYQLQDPFGLEPAWQQRALRRAQSIAPTGSAGGFRFDGSYSANGQVLRAVIDAEGFTAERSSPTPAEREASTSVSALSLDEALARRIIGDRWASLLELVGDELVIDVAVRAALRSAADILDTGRSRSESMRALTFPQFDQVIIAMGALPKVLGIALWRQLDERAERTAAIERRLELARCGAAFWAFEGLVIMMERPARVGFDDGGRLHAGHGPALAYPGGLRVWADHGVVVPERVIDDPGSITVEDVNSQTNAEVRRVMTERFGLERLIRDGGGHLVGQDETGRLWRRTRSHRRWDHEPLVMVEVQNSTPEPDGSVRTYFLRVPPDMRSARDAVAWTFGLRGSEYEPAHQT